MGGINCYLANEASGTVATDSWLTNDGTLAGASLPTIENVGMIGNYKFSGGNGVSAGDYNRIELTKTDYQYSAGDNFTIVIVAKPSTSTAQAQAFTMLDNANYNRNYVMRLEADAYSLGIRAVSSNQSVTATGLSIENKWTMMVTACMANPRMVPTEERWIFMLRFTWAGRRWIRRQRCQTL